MTLSCYGCSQEIILEGKNKFNPDNTVHECPRTNRKTSTTYTRAAPPAAAPAKSTYQKAPTEPTERDKYMKEMQISKQAHEIKVMESNATSSERIAGSNDAIADSNLKLAESYKYLTDSTNANTIELTKVVNQLTEILQKLSLHGGKK